MFYLLAHFSVLCCRWSVICWYSSFNRVLSRHFTALQSLSWYLLIGRVPSQR